jgi:hypothetical protein
MSIKEMETLPSKNAQSVERLCSEMSTGVTGHISVCSMGKGLIASGEQPGGSANATLIPLPETCNFNVSLMLLVSPRWKPFIAQEE